MRAAVGLAVDERAASPRVARAIRVARTVGAPLVPAIDAALAAAADDRARHRALEVATAQARTVAIGLVAAPVVLVPLLSRIAGADLVAFYRTPAGRFPLILGVGLLLVGAGMLHVLIDRAARPPGAATTSVVRPVVAFVVGLAVAGGWAAALAAIAVLAAGRRTRSASGRPSLDDEAVELVATAIDGGLTPASALRVAAGELPRHARDLRSLALELDHRRDGFAGGPDRHDTARSALGALLVASHRLGAPVVAALRDLGTRLRADQRAVALARVERLPAHLAFPTAILLLPGTVLLVGAPLAHAGVSHFAP